MHSEELRQIIEKAPESPIIRSKKIEISDVKSERIIGELRRCLAILFPKSKPIFQSHEVTRKKQVRLLKEAQANGYGVKITRKSVYLVPIEFDADIWKKYKNNTSELFHKGRIVKAQTNNLETLAEKGVFGEPEIDYPKYLMVPGSSVTTFPRGESENEVDLWLNRKELQKRRSLFIDPESIGSTPSHIHTDKLGESYVVFGGIPKEAIIAFQLPGEEKVELNQ